MSPLSYPDGEFQSSKPTSRLSATTSLRREQMLIYTFLCNLLFVVPNAFYISSKIYHMVQFAWFTMKNETKIEVEWADKLERLSDRYLHCSSTYFSLRKENEDKIARNEIADLEDFVDGRLSNVQWNFVGLHRPDRVDDGELRSQQVLPDSSRFGLDDNLHECANWRAK